MNTRRLIILITFLAVFTMAARVSVDSDTFWHLRAGAWIADHGKILQYDPFSYTRLNQAWPYPGWLVEVPMILIFRAFSYGGLNIWTGLMVTLTFAFIWPRLRGGAFLRAFLLIFATVVSGVYWAARPHLMTFLLSAVYLWVLDGARWVGSDDEPATPAQVQAMRRRIWWLPVLMVVWVNSHAGFAVGFILLGAYGLAEVMQWATARIRRQAYDTRWLLQMIAVGVAMLVAMCINPTGVQMLWYPFKTVSIIALQDYIAEWQSPNFHQLHVQLALWMLIALIGVLGVSRKRLALSDFLLLAIFTYLALMAGRNIALFALVAALAMSRHLAPVMAEVGARLGFSGASSASPTRLQAWFNTAILAVVLLAAFVKVANDALPKTNTDAIAKILPVQAVDYIRQTKPPGRLFNSYNWGAYLLWDLPEYLVYVDGRTDLYNDEVIGEWLQVVRGQEGWQAILDKWDVHVILLEPAAALVGQLPYQGWREVYRDDLAVVYQRP